MKGIQPGGVAPNVRILNFGTIWQLPLAILRQPSQLHHILNIDPLDCAKTSVNPIDQGIGSDQRSWQ